MYLVNRSIKLKAPVIATTIEQVQSEVANWRRSENKIAFVPTMGNLHEGHLALVKAAFDVADRVVVSIFVNPTQFGENEDFSTYPRTFDEDMAKLAILGVDMIFSPEVEVLYPESTAAMSSVTVPALSDILEGQFRPGFFTGVATVVNKLFNIVNPDVAFFGEKDYQQLLVIKKMVSELLMPVEIRSVATIREDDGLAMSSRNGYLQKDERQCANNLYRVLQELVASVQEGAAYEVSEKIAVKQLQQAGFVVDYVNIRRQQDLMPATAEDNHLVVLAAVRLKETRLIDNILFQLSNDNMTAA